MSKWKCYKKAFGDTWIRSLKADTNLQISDTMVPGLYLRYSCATDRIAFYLGCRIKATKQHRNILLGKYGDFSIKDIRERAIDLRKRILDGYDPMQDAAEKRKQAEEEKAHNITVKELFPQYIEKYAKQNKKPITVKWNEGQYRNDIEPEFGDMIVGDLKLSLLQDAYDKWAARTSYSSANKLIALISSFWNWCEKYEYLPNKSNPCHLVTKKKNAKMEYQILGIPEYKRLFAALDDGIINGPVHHRVYRALKVLALTGCRCSEITNLLKEETLLEQKKLKLKDSKTGPREVPLGSAAIEEIQKALDDPSAKDSIYVFPATQRKDGAITNLNKTFAKVLEKAGLPHMRIHDLRHSFISAGANMGVNVMALKEVAGHTQITTTEGYSHMTDKTKTQTADDVTKQIYG